jgi:uncharacterized membrane protein YeiH
VLYGFQLLGVAAFAISGVVASRGKRPDVVGAFVIAFATALGGGVLRDAILGHPAQSFRDGNYFAVIVGATLLAMWLPGTIRRLGPTLRVADAIGLGLFNAAGTVMALESGSVTPAFAVVLGAVTGSGGGMLRDVLCGEMPALLQPGELYITTCVAGGIAGLAALQLGGSMALASATIAGVTIGMRLLAIRFAWKLAPFHRDERAHHESANS